MARLHADPFGRHHALPPAPCPTHPAGSLPSCVRGADAQPVIAAPDDLCRIPASGGGLLIGWLVIAVELSGGAPPFYIRV